MKYKDKRKRTHCRICKKRVNLVNKKMGKEIYFFCPNCGGHGKVRYKC